MGVTGVEEQGGGEGMDVTGGAGNRSGCWVIGETFHIFIKLNIHTWPQKTGELFSISHATNSLDFHQPNVFHCLFVVAPQAST